MSSTHDVFSKHKENKMHWEQGTVYDVAWSSDGNLLTASGAKGPVRSWRLGRGGHKEGDEHKGLTSDIERLAWCPPTHDGNLLAAASYEKHVYLWDQRSGSVQQTLTTNKANSELQWMQSGKYLLVASRDEGIDVFDVANTQQPVVSATADGSLNAARWSIDGRLLFLATHAGNVEVYSWPAMEHVTVVPAHAASCNCLGVDPRGLVLATGSADATMELWNMEDFSLMRTLPEFESPLMFTEFSMDGRYIASASDDLEIKIHETEGALVHKLKLSLLTTALAWHPRNLAFAYGSTAPSKSGAKPAVTIFL
ncbi:hypothetical protein IWW51_002813 [Coemansia sp. RSA 2702]|nr:hypothetical protein IWW51_002813 [Coemansia sp. RSA 2702]